MNYSHFCLLFICLHLTSCGIIVPPIEGELDWWQNSVIYEIFPLSFKDSDGDGLGDFKGITQKLDYLVDLGVTAIWLTPFFESPLHSDGYDISDYMNVQKVFGTKDDIKNLINTAHEKDIKFIMDFVPNHSSNEHVWFKHSVNNVTNYTDYYIWKDAKNQDEVMKNKSIIPVVPNNWKRICNNGEDTSAWFWDVTRKQFYFSQFIANLPDLNFRNKYVHLEMKNILNYWFGLGVDGIRIDALKHVYESSSMKDEPINDPTRPEDYSSYLKHIYTVDQVEVYDLIKEWRLIMDEYKQHDNHTRIMMTESYSSLDVLFKYYTSGAEIPSNFNLISNIRHTPKDFDREIQNWISKMPKGSTYNVALQNHDSRRFSTVYGKQLIDGMNALSLFLPGVAVVYYGGEIGMKDIPDQIHFSRAPMQWDNTKYAGFTNNTMGPWITIHPDYVTRNVESENIDPKSYLNFFKSVLRLRQTETLKRGGLATYIFNDTVFVLNRFLPGNENYTLLINMDSISQHVRLSDQIPNLNGSLIVVVGSGDSNFYPGNSISTESLILNPGATIILGDNSKPKTMIMRAQTSSLSVKLHTTFKVLLLCLIIIKLCN